MDVARRLGSCENKIASQRGNDEPESSLRAELPAKHPEFGKTESFKSAEVLPLRPEMGKSKSVIAPLSSSHHSQRAYCRPDVWVGPQSGAKGTPKRSWRPKQPIDVAREESAHDCDDDVSFFDGSNHSAPTIFKSNNHVSPKPDTSISISEGGTIPDFGEPEESTLGDVVISTKAKQHCLDLSVHSTLTEDSKSRFSDAMEMWRSAAPVDVQHEGVPIRIDIDSSSAEVLSPLQRISKKSDARFAACKPTVREGDSMAAVTMRHHQSPTSRQPNRGIHGKVEMWQSKSAHAPRTEPMWSVKPKDDGEESAPCLADSVTSISQHFDDSHHSFKTCVTSLSTSSLDAGERSYFQRSASVGLRPTEMLPLKPGSPSKQNANESGIIGSSSLSPKNTHAFRAHSRPDIWVGPRGKPAKRSWKVKRIVEANEFLSDDDDGK